MLYLVIRDNLIPVMNIHYIPLAFDDSISTIKHALYERRCHPIYIRCENAGASAI